MSLRPFNPHYGANRIVSAKAVSESIPLNKESFSVRIINLSNSAAFVRIGSGSIEASDKDTPIRANSEIILSKAFGADTIAYIRSVGANVTLHIQTGQGGV